MLHLTDINKISPLSWFRLRVMILKGLKKNVDNIYRTYEERSFELPVQFRHCLRNNFDGVLINLLFKNHLF